MSYTPPAGTGLPFNFTGSAYTPPAGGSLSADFATLPSVQYVNVDGVAGAFGDPAAANFSPSVIPAGIHDAAFGTPTTSLAARQVITQWTTDLMFGAPSVAYLQVVTATGFSAGAFGNIFAVVNGYYTPPYGTALPMNFTGGYVPPSGGAVPFDFLNTYVFRQIAPAGMVGAIGSPSVQNEYERADVPGLSPGSFGTPVVTAPVNQTIMLTGIDSLEDGTALVLNWIQPTAPAGIASIAFGTTAVRNATETQYAAPAGITGAFGDVEVSPRFVYAQQFTSWGVGVPNVQPHPFPVGFDSSAVGTPTVSDDTQTLSLTGFDSAAYGQPSAVILLQIVRPPSLVESGIFGDGRTYLKTRTLYPSSVDDGFISPFAVAINRNRVVLPYSIVGAFGTAATANVSPNLTPVGIDSATFGTANVGDFYRRVHPISIIGGVGVPVVENTADTVAPTGFTGVFGDPTVTRGIRYVEAAGFDASSVPQPTIWFARRAISGPDFDASLFGEATVNFENRTIPDVRVDVSSEGYGTPGVSFRVRTVTFTGIGFGIGGQFGAARVADAAQTVIVPGIAEGLFGAAATARDERAVSPAGIAGSIGTADVQLLKRYVLPGGFSNTQKFGAFVVHNSRQYVTQIYSPDSAVLTGAVGIPSSVANRNRVVGAYGFDMATVSNAFTVERRAIDIHPVGFDASLFGTAVAGYSTRYVLAEGFDAFFGHYAAVHNGSEVVHPTGIAAGSAGAPTVVDTTQYLNRITVGDFDGAGVPMVSFAIRTVTVNGIEEPRSLPHDVRLSTRYISPTGFTLGFGAATVEEHFNIVAARGYPMDSYGTGHVGNVTPNIYVWPTVDGAFGAPTIINRNAYVGPEGFTTIWGSATVSYRTRYVVPSGFDASRVSASTDVRLDIPQSPAEQTVLAIGFDEMAFGTAVMDQRGILLTGFDSSLFGRPSLLSHAVGPVTINYDYSGMFGIPTLNPLIRVLPFSIANLDVGVPRLSPTTIDMDVVRLPPAEIDYETDEENHPWFGRSTVTLANRVVAQRHNDELFGAMGVPAVDLRNRYIQPVGLRAWRVGIPTIPSNWEVKPFWGRTTEEEVEGGNFDTATYGEATVTHAEELNRTIAAQGFAGTFGATEVQNQNRTISVTGIYSTIFTGDTLVAPPDPLEVAGFASQAFGTTFVSHRIRTVTVDSTGMDTIWGVGYGGGIYPMTVRFSHFPANPTSIPAGEVGIPYVGLFLATVAPPGAAIVDFPTPTVSGRNELLGSGFESLQMGTPKRAIQGEVDPHGDDMLGMGIGRIDRIMHAAYIEPGAAGTPRIKTGIHVVGMDTLFGDTVVVGESNCGSTLAIVAQLGDLTQFGQTGVGA